MIVWIDLETTGLDPKRCNIIEVACVITTDNYNELESYTRVIHPPFDCWWDSVAKEMHASSGLFDEQAVSSTRIHTAERDIVELIHKRKGNKPFLGGQSVHFDRSFMDNEMPFVCDLLSHRHVDISTIKIFWANALEVDSTSIPPKKSETTHRAMDDILASIEAAKWYKNRLKFINHAALDFSTT